MKKRGMETIAWRLQFSNFLVNQFIFEFIDNNDTIIVPYFFFIKLCN